MKTKTIIVTTILFATSLILFLRCINPAGAAITGELFQGYNTERGKWVNANLGKAYYEGDWVSYQLRIARSSKVWDLPYFDIKYNFYQPSSDAIYVDGFDTSEETGFQWWDGAVHPMLPDETEVPPSGWGTHIPTPESGELAGTTNIVNFMDPLESETPDSPSEFRYFTVEGIPWGSVTGDYIVLFFRAHLALDIIWSIGEEGALPPELDGNEFEGWTATHHGSSFATGSSRHFWLMIAGVGGKAVPIPIVEYPATLINGHKYVGGVLFDDWEITLHGDLWLSSSLPPIPYDPPSVYTGTTPWTTGYFEFTGLIKGTYTLTEESRVGIFHDRIEVTIDGMSFVVFGVNTVSFDLDRGESATVDFYNALESITTTQLSSGSITIGESVTDTITISTTATGTLPEATGTWTLNVADNMAMTGAITIGSGSVSGYLPFTTSVTWTPPYAGTWWFQAFYSGDSYLPSQSDPADEELVVEKAPTTTVTNLSFDHITIGESVTDTITIDTTAIGALPEATGTWTLNVADNIGMSGAITIGSGSVSGYLPFTTSVTWTPPYAGTWWFQAFHSGDGNYEASESDPADEELVVEKAPTITETALSSSHITIGESVTDTITISTTATGALPEATGTWTLKVADNMAMTGAITIGSGSVSGYLPFTTSVTWTPPYAGTWWFQAFYSGDGNYEASQSDPADEELLVEKAPTITETALSSSHITIGESVTDTITISTTATGALPEVTGTWTLKVADNVAMTGAITIGSGSVSGYLPFTTSVIWTPPYAGTWWFQAFYSGDGNYEASESDPADEELVVEKAPTTTVTNLSFDHITIGESVTDTITIDTTAMGTLPEATGTWTLNVADNIGMSGAITIGSGDVSGYLPFTTSVTWTPPYAGTWWFQAFYSGDPNYEASQSDPADEELVVVAPYAGTIGYWMNHPEAWIDTGISPDDPFPWTTGRVANYTYMQILQTEPSGDQSIQLARQYIGAKLNQLKWGVPSEIEAKIAEAEAFLAMHRAGSDPQGDDRAYAVELAEILEAYNSGKPPYEWVLPPPDS